MVEFDLDKVNELLQQLEGLPRVKEITELKKRLTKEKQKLVSKKMIEVSVPSKEITQSNVSRSNKLQRYWRYIRLIRDNFPNLTVSQIRTQFTQRRQGNQVQIPDAVWQNPSP